MSISRFIAEDDSNIHDVIVSLTRLKLMKFFLFVFYLVRATLMMNNLSDLIAILDAFWAKVQRMAELTHPDMNARDLQ